MQPNKTLIHLAYLSVLPLIFALFLAVINVFEWPLLPAKMMSFARINSYIYAHSYGMVLLTFFSGMQIGMVLEKPQTQFYLVFNFVVLLLSWLSFKSFADMNGMMLLLCCQIAVALVDHLAGKNQLIQHWYAVTKLKINASIIIILSALILINR